MILGVVRGGGNPRHQGGRPAAAEDGLVMLLAMDWLQVTGHSPQPGRSDHLPFGQLVHHVFGWLDLENASSCLRRYWRAVAAERRRSRNSSR